MKRSCDTCEWWEHDAEPSLYEDDPDLRLCHGSPAAQYTSPKWWCATWRVAERLAQQAAGIEPAEGAA